MFIAAGRDTDTNLIKEGQIVLTENLYLRSASVSANQSFEALATSEGVSTRRARTRIKLVEASEVRQAGEFREPTSTKEKHKDKNPEQKAKSNKRNKERQKARKAEKKAAAQAAPPGATPKAAPQGGSASLGGQEVTPVVSRASDSGPAKTSGETKVRGLTSKALPLTPPKLSTNSDEELFARQVEELYSILEQAKQTLPLLERKADNLYRYDFEVLESGEEILPICVWCGAKLLPIDTQ